MLTGDVPALLARIYPEGLRPEVGEVVAVPGR